MVDPGNTVKNTSVRAGLNMGRHYSTAEHCIRAAALSRVFMSSDKQVKIPSQTFIEEVTCAKSKFTTSVHCDSVIAGNSQ